MDLQERLVSDLKEAMRAGDVDRRESIRMLRAAIKNEEIAVGHALSDQETQAIVARIAKRHRESIDQFERGNRPDLVAHEQAQLAALGAYLPQLMSRPEIESEVRSVIAELGGDGPPPRGQLMGALAKRLRGRADLGEVNSVVQELLESGSRG
jgi:uncharacterized protein